MSPLVRIPKSPLSARLNGHRRSALGTRLRRREATGLARKVRTERETHSDTFLARKTNKPTQGLPVC